MVTLGGANVAGILISLITVPLLSRLYSPVEYGAFAIIAMVGALISPLSNLAYQDAVVIAPTTSAAMNVVALCVAASTVVATTTATVLLTLAGPIASWLQFSGSPRLLALAALSILLSGTAVPLSYLANREQRYRLLAGSRLCTAIVTTSTSVGLAQAHAGAVGLMIAAVAGTATGLIILVVGQRRTLRAGLPAITLTEVKAQAREHANFPRYTLPTNFINSVTDNLPRTLIAAMFGESVLGLFSRASSLLALPAQVAGAPVGEIFRRDLSRLATEKADPMPLFRRTATTLAKLASLGLVITLLTAPWIFPLVLGERWRGSGEYAQLLAPMFALRLINSPLSFVVFLVKQHKFDLTMTVFLLFASIATMSVAYLISHSQFVVIGVYSAVCGATSVYMMRRNFQFARELPRGTA